MAKKGYAINSQRLYKHAVINSELCPLTLRQVGAGGQAVG